MNALTLSPSDADWSGYQVGNVTVETLLSQDGIDCDELYEAYKQNAGPDENVNGGFEEGSFAAFYSTTFNSDLSGGSVVWDGPGFIAGDEIYLAVKDGTPRPYYIFDISSWDGQETISLSGFYPAQGAISHVSIFTCGTAVPDGGASVLLLGMGLVVLGFSARRIRG